MSNPISVSFPGGKRVQAHFGEFSVLTDQSIAAGGEGCAPAAFDLFLAALAACAGTYALAFCQSRGLSTEGLHLVQSYELDLETKLPRALTIAITLPSDFPDKYKAAIVRAVESCKVKKTIAASPRFDVVIEGADR